MLICFILVYVALSFRRCEHSHSVAIRVLFTCRELSTLIKELGEAFISKRLKFILVIPPPLYSK